METSRLNPTRESVSPAEDVSAGEPPPIRLAPETLGVFSKITAMRTGTGWSVDRKAGLAAASDGDEQSRNMLDAERVKNLTRNSGSLADGSSGRPGVIMGARACSRKRAACLRKRRRVRRTDGTERSRNVYDRRRLKNLFGEFGWAAAPDAVAGRANK